MAPPAKNEKRQEAENNRLAKDITGLGVTKIVLTNVYFKCTHCDGMFPGDMVGLRHVSASNEVRNQPRCRECRKYD